MRSLLVLFVLTSLLAACTAREEQPAFDIDIDDEEFTLENGLRVLFHVDRSSPTVTVRMTTHAGSAREVPGRTGFAHLFEHLLFLESENLGRGGLDRMSARIGGSGANGSTDRDDTRYDQTVPNDALEKLIWAEADRLGYFINTVTEPVLAKEKQVVKNEKRERYDNRAYGHKDAIILPRLYPEGHPYSWPVIGSLDDLEAAALDDVKEFYGRWYVPNNVVLTIAGDFDVDRASTWVHKYFDDIERGDEVEPVEVDTVMLPGTRRLVYEDQFATTPELTLVWPAPPQHHDDSYAMSVLIDYLGRGKEAPLRAVVVDERKTSPRVTARYSDWELAGEVSISATPFDGHDLNDVFESIEEALGRFESEGMPQEALERRNTRAEVRFYDLLLSPAAKAGYLTNFVMFKGDAGYYKTDIEKRRAVTTADVRRVYETYIKGRPFIALSMVPEGSRHMALDDSQTVEVPEEHIVAGAEDDIVIPDGVTYEKSWSSFDRSVEPPLGKTPVPQVPDVWNAELDNGLHVLGVERDDVPLVKFQMIVDGGMWFDDPGKIGTANLLAESLMHGTKRRTTAELEAAIRDLGSSISVRAGRGSLSITGTTLTRNFDATMSLLEEILLQPRFDEQEFAISRDRTIANLESWARMPSFVSREVLRELIVGKSHQLAANSVGSPESVAALTTDELRAYYDAYIKPNLGRLHVVGAVSREQVLESLRSLGEHWQPGDVSIPQFEIRERDANPILYFYDIPDAKQSAIRVGQIAVPDRHPDFERLRVVNYKLGGAGFVSLLMQQLRDQYGYTYNAGSSFRGNRHYGAFVVSTNVRSNVTAESLKLIRDILDRYPEMLTDEILRETRNSITRKSLLQDGGLAELLRHLSRMSEFGLPADFRQRELEMINSLEISEIRALARQYIDTDHVFYLVVGDAKTQLERIRELGFERVVVLDGS